ncbi:MAG: iron-sulfur cluster assembly scaffold protein [Gammaproteobacteria bacterium]|nr:iron-sulfur cluster assembly scaffold protein [Gammaproteobacteria bacterium]
MPDPFAAYSDTVRAHFRTPRNAGGFAAGHERILAGSAGQRRYGREVEFQLQVTAEGRIGDCRYRVYGCPATIALCSLTSEALKGRTPAEAAGFSVVTLAEQLGLPAEKRAAAVTVEDAVRAAAGRYNAAPAISPAVPQLQA